MLSPRCSQVSLSTRDVSRGRLGPVWPQRSCSIPDPSAILHRSPANRAAILPHNKNAETSHNRLSKVNPQFRQKTKLKYELKPRTPPGLKSILIYRILHTYGHNFLLRKTLTITIHWPSAAKLGHCFSSWLSGTLKYKQHRKKETFPNSQSQSLEKHHNAKHRLPYASSKSYSPASWKKRPLKDIKDKRHHFWLRKSFLEAESILAKYCHLLAPFW